MPIVRFVILTSLSLLCLTSGLASQEKRVTSIKVLAYEYRDYYGLPDTERWRKVESIKIEGQNRSGSIHAFQSGPAEQLEATLTEVTPKSNYWITVTWENGCSVSQTHVSGFEKERVHEIYQP